jgi:iron complex outermembrane receptor protein
MKNWFLLISLFVGLNNYAQSINGIVLNNDNKPLTGATVQIKNTFVGTFTDETGQFNLEYSDKEEIVLVASFLGYETTEIILTSSNESLKIVLKENVIQQSEVVVYGTRANSETPTANKTLDKKDIEKLNIGQDIPFILNQTPSLVVSSDAGAGVGYTDMRIRGTDVTRINVTINGIPLNDPESQGVYWVNMPDFSSSLESIQVQRGVGTSTNGSAAFGASVNLQTSNNAQNAYAETNLTYGSFNTQKYTALFGTGLINDHWAFDGRFSKISSDGYIDRAFSDLKSYYLSGGYYGKYTTVKAVHFSGKEKTYQAWWGTPESALNNDETDKLDYASSEGLSSEQTTNLLNADRRYNHYLYENEVDNYGQDHYQLHLTHQFNTKVYGNVSLHYTHGEGYFEQYKENEDFEDYGLQNATFNSDTVTSTDLIRRRWLDNDFYGAVYNLNIELDENTIQFGGAINKYSGSHFGEIIWADVTSNSDINFKYYDNLGEKEEASFYAKLNSSLSAKINLFIDIQARFVNYKAKGIDNDLRSISIDKEYAFVNPKAGFNYKINATNRAFFSVAFANREPTRTDFLDAGITEPKPELLIDYELGLERKTPKYQSAINMYYMDYKNQLIPTGALNDVGSSIKTNVDESYRAGVEVSLSYRLSKSLTWSANYTYSQNIIKNFTSVVYDYTYGFDVIQTEIKNTQIALSPSHIAKSNINFSLFKNLSLSIQSSLVGKQYLDNTTNESRTIDSYFVNDLVLNYSFEKKLLKKVSFTLAVNNLLNVEYASRGYTYSYIYGAEYTQNHYNPQATRNFLAAMSIRF